MQNIRPENGAADNNPNKVFREHFLMLGDYS